MKVFGTEVNLISAWDVVQSFMGRRSHVASESKSEAGLKSGFLRISKNDEALFDDAIALAFQDEKSDHDLETKVQKLRMIFAELDHGERKRLFQTIGIDEQAVIETEPKSVEYTDGKGNVRVKIDKKEKKYNINARGKRFIQFLSRLSFNEAVLFLRASATLTGPVDDLAHFWSVAKPFLVSTWNSVEAERRTRDAIFWYIGARDIVEAEAIVSAKERALEMRQQQTWYERNYGNRAYIRRWRILFATSIMALTYILTR